MPKNIDVCMHYAVVHGIRSFINSRFLKFLNQEKYKVTNLFENKFQRTLKWGTKIAKELTFWIPNPGSNVRESTSAFMISSMLWKMKIRIESLCVFARTQVANTVFEFDVYREQQQLSITWLLLIINEMIAIIQAFV